MTSVNINYKVDDGGKPMTKRILYIKPTHYAAVNEEIQDYLNKYRDPGSQVDVICMPRGPQHLEYLYYQSIAQLEILKAVKQAEKKGYDAAVIGCFDDPGLYEAREICETMCVAGPGEAAMGIASILGSCFSIIVGREKWVPQIRDNTRKYGHADRLASCQSLGLGVLDFQRDHAEMAKRMRQACEKALLEDKAEVIILGCTMEFGFFAELQQEYKVPILDAMLCSLKQAEFLADLHQQMDWYTSKAGAFATPPKGEIKEWQLAQDYDLGDIWD